MRGTVAIVYRAIEDLTIRKKIATARRQHHQHLYSYSLYSYILDCGRAIDNRGRFAPSIIYGRATEQSIYRDKPIENPL